MYEKLTKCSNFTYLPEKNNKIPEFYMVIGRKYFLLFWGGGHVPLHSRLLYTPMAAVPELLRITVRGSDRSAVCAPRGMRRLGFLGGSGWTRSMIV